MKKTIRIILYLSICIFAIGCTSNKLVDTIITDNDETLHQILRKADKDTLVIFDCDEVLITPTDTLLSPVNKSIYKKMTQYLTQKFGQSKADDILVDIRKSYKFKLVDKDLPDVIKNLQANGIKVLVLTANWTGKFHSIEYVEHLRRDELKPFDFNFKKSWSSVDKIVFYELPSVLPGYNLTRYPVFEDGILYSCHVEKGLVLQQFFNHVSEKFNKIIFVDDKKKNVQSIREFCENNGIQGYCVQYKKVKKNDKITIDSQELERQVQMYLPISKAERER